MHSRRQINSVLVDESGHILTILLTGGIGSGKSLAAKYLVDMGIPVYDFDSRTKELYDKDLDLCGRVAEAVRPYSGEEVLTADGHINRSALARTVFGNSAALEALEAVVHPAVLADFKAWRAEYSQRFAETLAAGTHKVVCGCLVSEKRGVRRMMVPMVAAESAIALSKPLFADEFDKVILIAATEDVRKNRVIARDGLSEDEVTARMQTQSCASTASPSPKVDFVIDNNGDMDELKERLYEIVEKIDPKANERCER